MRDSFEVHEDGKCHSGQFINNQRNADDIIFVAKTCEQLQRIVNSVYRTCCMYKLVINATITKSKDINRRHMTH